MLGPEEPSHIHLNDRKLSTLVGRRRGEGGEREKREGERGRDRGEGRYHSHIVKSWKR